MFSVIANRWIESRRPRVSISTQFNASWPNSHCVCLSQNSYKNLYGTYIFIYLGRRPLPRFSQDISKSKANSASCFNWRPRLKSYLTKLGAEVDSHGERLRLLTMKSNPPSWRERYLRGSCQIVHLHGGFLTHWQDCQQLMLHSAEFHACAACKAASASLLDASWQRSVLQSKDKVAARDPCCQQHRDPKQDGSFDRTQVMSSDWLQKHLVLQQVKSCPIEETWLS